MRAVLLALILMAFGAQVGGAAPLSPRSGLPWRIVKDHWDAADERGFSAFVTAIGRSGCSSSESCLRDPANPFRASDRHFLDVDVDCAALVLAGSSALVLGLDEVLLEAAVG